jgi:dTDP-L-rhamnose 4-epimerase
MTTVLITGGAGFIGSHLATELVEGGYSVIVVDNMSPQIHASKQMIEILPPEVEFYKGDVRDANLMKKLLVNVDCLVHLAAETGTGQSMYEIKHYFDVNIQGTATILDILKKGGGRSLQTIIVASSRAVYGEGAFNCRKHGIVFPKERQIPQMELGNFDVYCPLCSQITKLYPTNEMAPFEPSSFYALTKQVQEQSVLIFAKLQGLNAYALRFQNVYGPWQSLKNPYTGILSIFSNLARQNMNIEVYEDGLESRDFVFVEDAVKSTVMAIENTSKFVGPINIGSGKSTSVLDVANTVHEYFDSKGKIIINGTYRLGDIRHSVADITKMKEILNYLPKYEFVEGVNKFLKWVSKQPYENKFAYNDSKMQLQDENIIFSKK